MSNNTKSESSENSDSSDESTKSEDGKQCVTCRQLLPLTRFKHIADQNGNLKYYSKNCKNCERTGQQHIKRVQDSYKSYKTNCRLTKLPFKELINKEEPIVIGILASSRSGKTTLLYHIIEYMKDYYDVILFFSANSNSKIYKNFKSKKIIMVNGFDDRIIYAMHHLNQSCDGRFNFLVIMDDIIDTKYSQCVTNLFSIYRNANFSTIHCVQYKKYMSKDARAQCHKILCGKQNNMEEIQDTCETYLYGFPPLMECIPKEIHTKSFTRHFKFRA